MTDDTFIIRDADTDDIFDLAQIWYYGWQDAHAEILPVELAKHRTLESFHERLATSLETVHVASLNGSPLGFSMVKNDELNQLYLSAAARGAGLAARLNRDALNRIRASGFRVGWLVCAIGNLRAARFYEKTGWRRTGTMTHELHTPDGLFPLDVWRYEVDLSAC